MQLEIASVTDGRSLPACTPSLMPFHIPYTGPAPVSRYFRPTPAPPSLAALPLRSSSSATLVASSSSTSILSEAKSSLTTTSSVMPIKNLAHESACGVGIVTGVDSETQPADDSPKATNAHTPKPRNDERFVAAFRGRQVYGQAVDIPSGYGGIVLRALSDSKCKQKEEDKPRSRTRAATRRFQRATVDDEPEGGGGGDSDIDPSPPMRKLVPSSTFTSFMLWTPDRPLDEGSDEYARALVEWTRLANEIHSYDECE